MYFKKCNKTVFVIKMKVTPTNKINEIIINVICLQTCMTAFLVVPFLVMSHTTGWAFKSCV